MEKRLVLKKNMMLTTNKSVQLSLKIRQILNKYMLGS